MSKYFFDNKISWKTFKKVMDFFPDTSGGPTPMHIDEILWRGLRDRTFHIGIEGGDDPVFISTKPIPKNAEIISDVSTKG